MTLWSDTKGKRQAGILYNPFMLFQHPQCYSMEEMTKNEHMVKNGTGPRHGQGDGLYSSSSGCCPAPMEKGIPARDVFAHLESLWETKEYRAVISSGHPHAISSSPSCSCPSALSHWSAKTPLSPTHFSAGESPWNYYHVIPWWENRSRDIFLIAFIYLFLHQLLV